MRKATSRAPAMTTIHSTRLPVPTLGGAASGCVRRALTRPAVAIRRRLPVPVTQDAAGGGPGHRRVAVDDPGRGAQAQEQAFQPGPLAGGQGDPHRPRARTGSTVSTGYCSTTHAAAGSSSRMTRGSSGRGR